MKCRIPIKAVNECLFSCCEIICLDIICHIIVNWSACLNTTVLRRDEVITVSAVETFFSLMSLF